MSVQTSTHVQRYFDVGTLTIRTPSWPRSWKVAPTPTRTYGPLTGETLVAYAQGLLDAFPDLTFENVQHDVRPTGRRVPDGSCGGPTPAGCVGRHPGRRSLPGVDVITTRTTVCPPSRATSTARPCSSNSGCRYSSNRSAGPFRFGYGLKTETETADPPVPGATRSRGSEPRSEAEADEVRALTRPIAALRSSPDSSAGWASASATACTRSPRGERGGRTASHGAADPQAGSETVLLRGLRCGVHTAVWTAGRVQRAGSAVLSARA